MLVLALMGLAFLGTAWAPNLIGERPLSFPILYVILGVVLFKLPLGLQLPNPLESGLFTQHFSELLVIVALTGAGLKLARPVGLRRWSLTWRLLGFAMPMCIAAVALLGWSLMGLPIAAAVLLGAVLAPTDPVLASDVQVGAPKDGAEGEVRFALTSEAGLNDGLAFPFTNLAIALAAGAGFGWFQEWLLVDVLYKLVVGAGVGLLLGWLLTQVIFRLPEDRNISSTQDGLVALGVTLFSYGATELLHGYGFVAVFLAALVLRQNERSHRYHEVLHEFSEGLERLLLTLILILFGGLVAGGLLQALTWQAVLVGLLVIFAVRPVTGYLALLGSGRPLSERATISFFGIRGVGSLYYLAYALNQEDFGVGNTLWSVVSFVILVSIFVHGASATLVMRRLDQRSAPPKRQPVGNVEGD